MYHAEAAENTEKDKYDRIYPVPSTGATGQGEKNCITPSTLTAGKQSSQRPQRKDFIIS